jgi:hypothetical protein
MSFRMRPYWLYVRVRKIHADAPAQPTTFVCVIQKEQGEPYHNSIQLIDYKKGLPPSSTLRASGVPICFQGFVIRQQGGRLDEARSGDMPR